MLLPSHPLRRRASTRLGNEDDVGLPILATVIVIDTVSARVRRGIIAA